MKKHFHRALSLMISALIALSSVVVFIPPAVVLAGTHYTSDYSSMPGYPDNPAKAYATGSPTATARLAVLNANGGRPWEDESLPIEWRVQLLVDAMTVQEKAGQTLQLQRDAIGTSGANITNYYLGSILSGGGSVPSPNTPAGWTTMMNTIQDAAYNTPLRIPVLYQIDAVHGTGHMNSSSATNAHTTIYPHNYQAANIGEGITDLSSPKLQYAIDLVKDYAHATAEEMLAIGIPGTFAPAACVPQNYRWGRTHEGWNNDPVYNGIMTAAYTEGMQGGVPTDYSALNTDYENPNQYPFLANADSGIVCMKHYAGEGYTWNGANADNGDMRIPSLPTTTAGLKALTVQELLAVPEIKELIIPYQMMVEAGARSFMPSYTAINGVRMHEFGPMMDILKKPKSEGGLGFTGFAVGDYQGHQRSGLSSSNQATRNALCMNAGLDLCMGVTATECTNTSTGWYNTIQASVAKASTAADYIPMSRLNDACARILRVKFELGLFETQGSTTFAKARANTELQSTLRNEEHVGIAREMVRESQVLLKNDPSIWTDLQTLDASEILVAGSFMHNIGYQVGSWVVSWQGASSTTYDVYKGRMIDDAIKDVKGTDVLTSSTGATQTGADNVKVAFVCVGETPYAEGSGDQTAVTTATAAATLQITDAQLGYIQNVKTNYPNAKIVVLLLTGRPMVISGWYDDVDAIVMSGWFGTEAGGVADVLVGGTDGTQYDFNGRTAFSWPISPECLGDLTQPNLFDIGFGLTKNSPKSETLVRPDLQGAAINLNAQGTTSWSGTIFTQNNSLGVSNWNRAYNQPVYWKQGYISSSTLVSPSTRGAYNTGGRTTYVEYKIKVQRPGTYTFGYTGSGSSTNGLILSIDGGTGVTFNAATSVTNVSMGNLSVGEHIMRLTFNTNTAMTITEMNVTAPGGYVETTIVPEVSSVVAGFNANIPVATSADDGSVIKIESGNVVLGEATVTDGKATVVLNKANLTAAGTIHAVVYVDGAAQNSAPISVVTYDPAIWEMKVESRSNSVAALFNANISLDPALFDVKVNGVSLPEGNTSVVGADGKSFNINGAQIDFLNDGDKFEITGIRLPDLFPDYTFTYRATLAK